MQRYGRFVKLQETWVEKLEEITSFKVLLSVLSGGLDKLFSKAGKISFLRARVAARRAPSVKALTQSNGRGDGQNCNILGKDYNVLGKNCKALGFGMQRCVRRPAPARRAARRVRGEPPGAWQDAETDLAASGGVSACGQVRIGGRRMVRISVPSPSAYACRRLPDKRRRGASG